MYMPVQTETTPDFDDITAKINTNSFNIATINKNVGSDHEIVSGSFTGESNAWSSSYFTLFVAVKPNSKYKITSQNVSGRKAVFMGLKSVTIPPTVGDTPDCSSETGWTTLREVGIGATEEGYLPNDVNYLYVYAGTNRNYTRLRKRQ